MATDKAARTIDGLARRQHGVFARQQVIEAGMTRHELQGLVSSGRWIVLAPAVYALASHPGTWKQRLMAAVLGEPEAAVGGRSAAVLHGFTGFRPGRPEIVVPRAGQNRSPIALVRRRDGVETTRRNGLPVLTTRDALFAVAGLVRFAPSCVPPSSALERLLYGVLDRPGMPRYSLHLDGPASAFRPRGWRGSVGGWTSRRSRTRWPTRWRPSRSTGPIA
jgi:hypothetical protein